MTLKPFLGALVLTLAGAGSLSAATLTFELKETGSDVLLTVSGALSDSTPWTYCCPIINPVVAYGDLHASVGRLGVRSGYLVDLYTGNFPTPPFGFGSAAVSSFGTLTLAPTSSTVLISVANGSLNLPQNYTWGAPLAAEATFGGQDFSTMGLTAGESYSWVMGNDIIEVKIGGAGNGGGGSAVPETGTTLAGLALALAGLVTLRQRAGRRGAAQA